MVYLVIIGVNCTVKNKYQIYVYKIINNKCFNFKNVLNNKTNYLKVEFRYKFTINLFIKFKCTL